MRYYIGVDTLELGDLYGYGVVIVRDDRGWIIKHFKSQDKTEFYQELQRIKDQYQPHEIQEWSF